MSKQQKSAKQGGTKAKSGNGGGKGPGGARKKNGGAGRMPSGVAAAYSSAQIGTSPIINATATSCRIRHRELIGSVVGTTAFSIIASNTFAVNPGLSESFPWLASQAAGWEEYQFSSIKYEYFTRTGTGVPGSVMLIPDYDARDSAPADEKGASAAQDVVEDAPWKNICCVLRGGSMAGAGRRKYIRSGPAPSNTDIKTYDCANFFVATVDGTAVNWGKLWVEYDVTFYIPQQPSPLALSQHIVGATPTSALLVGTAASTASSDIIVSVANEVVTFLRAGRFFVYLIHLSTTSSTVTANPVVAGGGAGQLIWQGVFAAGDDVFTGDGTTAMSQAMLVEATVGTTITFNNTVVLGLTADLLVLRTTNNFL